MTLYQHQVDGAAWLAARARAYLADQPGLGKTRTCIAALNAVKASQPLVVCPAIVRTHWQREFDACGWGRPAIVKSYDEIVRGGNALMRDLIVNEKIDALITDEHHYCKHATSKRTLQLFGRNGYARRLPRVYCASGTPVPKNPSELWTTIGALFPEIAIEHGLKSMDDFKARFCVTRTVRMRGKWIEQVMPTVNNADELREIMAKFMLARTLDDVGLDVPELDWQTTRLDAALDAGDRSILSHFAAMRPWHKLDGGALSADDAGAALGATVRAKLGESLAEIAKDPHIARMRRRLGELKVKPTLALLASQLEESDEKVVVFAHHRSVLHGLRDGLKAFGVEYVDGDTPQWWRDCAIDRFQRDPESRVFLGQNIACQTGITLTAARRVFLVEPDWTAVVNYQLGHRVARIGQKAERCIAHMIALAGTLDEAIINRNIQEVKMAAKLGLGE